MYISLYRVNQNYKEHFFRFHLHLVYLIIIVPILFLLKVFYYSMLDFDILLRGLRFLFLNNINRFLLPKIFCQTHSLFLI